ncbi:PTS sugar transporter subunit IIA [Olsenella sp. YH-ols2217]|uniref:PTS sugar transporter subunit IIA n=1 Tax=Kribbibacterium absianum TaxID=3044210 RepID=A0ABT6ZHI0_9ACTN|nr:MULTISPECIES: PTS sugar transporter subunit IIA [unclassified Olsenella]MDJ1121024.1 PTS sugar transporter subunit IIA [Olsenella sp. YH-ols2216]MDJ1128515.1 PTS sugar transporter subunit IIA [Olsenella sp. YH-ols2217]
MAQTVPADHVFLDIPAASRDEVLDFLCGQAVALGIASSAEGLKEGFLARETEGSTGMVAGFAVPHAQCDAVQEPGVLVVKLAQPVPWETMDGAPVDVAVAIVAPTDAAGHLRMLSKLAVALMAPDFSGSVHEAVTPEDVAALVNEAVSD